MKIFKIILACIALLLLIYNVTILDFSNLFGKESMIALIGIVACACAILLLAILNTAKRIDKKIKEKSN
jgi:uncharacterized integral membrane protein